MAHFVILKEEPSADRLAKLREGYQLWSESRTGLYFLTAHGKPLGKRPDFAGDLAREHLHKADVAPLLEYMADETIPVSIQKFEVSFDLMHQAVTLSKQLHMEVLVAESTDDEYAMAVAADRGAVIYVRFRTLLKDGPDEHGAYTGAEVVFMPRDGFSVREPTNAFCGVAEAGIEEVFGIAAPDLYNFTDGKPTREQAKARARAGGASVSAYLDSFGVFKRLSHAAPQLSRMDRLLIPFRIAGSAIVLPLLFAGITTWAIFFAGRPNADRDPPIWKIMLLGLGVLAIPLAVLIWIVRAIVGQ